MHRDLGLTRPLLILALGLTACGDSTGDGEAGEGSSSETSTSTDGTMTDGSITDPSATGPSSSTAGTTSPTSTTSTTSTTEDPTSGTDTSVGACELSKSFDCSMPLACDDACGGVDSPFDDAGCLRPTCARHRDCTDGEACYHPADYGGCASSSTTCSDAKDGTCECVSDPDCGGAYCIPPDIFFGGAEIGPTDGWADNECAPTDAPAFLLQLGLDANSCEGSPAGDPLIQIHVYMASGATGTFDVSETGGLVTYHPDGTLANPEIAAGAVVRIFSWDDGMVVGEYELGLSDTSVLFNSFAVPFCDNDVQCG